MSSRSIRRNIDVKGEQIVIMLIFSKSFRNAIPRNILEAPENPTGALSGNKGQIGQFALIQIDHTAKIFF